MKNRRFRLKQGDRVFVFIWFKDEGVIETWTTVRGFTALGVHYDSNPWGHAFVTGLFYGFGYDSAGHAIIVKKKWHLPFARLCEVIRLRLPQRISVLLHLE